MAIVCLPMPPTHVAVILFSLTSCRAGPIEHLHRYNATKRLFEMVARYFAQRALLVQFLV